MEEADAVGFVYHKYSVDVAATTTGSRQPKVLAPPQGQWRVHDGCAEGGGGGGG
jgi:hypothetical protein